MGVMAFSARDPEKTKFCDDHVDHLLTGQRRRAFMKQFRRARSQPAATQPERNAIG